jgi:hypothetical protein
VHCSAPAGDGLSDVDAAVRRPARDGPSAVMPGHSGRFPSIGHAAGMVPSSSLQAWHDLSQCAICQCAAVPPVADAAVGSAEPWQRGVARRREPGGVLELFKQTVRAVGVA